MEVNIWAKDNGVRLKEHVSHLLIAFEKIKDRISEELREPVKYAILLHDLGKVLPYFQIMSLKNKEYRPFNIDKGMNIYHSLASVLFIDKEEFKNLVKDTKIADFVISAVAYHHWKDSLEEDMLYGQEKFERLLGYGEKDSLVRNLRDELGGLVEGRLINFDEDMAKGLANGLSFVDYVIPPYRIDWLPRRLEIKEEEEKKKWILISGFLQRCDHYASFCEKDMEVFDKKGLETVEIENAEYKSIIENTKREISAKTGVDIGKIELWQEKVLKEHADKNLILVAPTGSGKTEFAFLWSSGSKLIYTLPLRAAVEQIFGRAKKIFGEEKTGILHGDADVYVLRELRKREDSSEQMEKIEEQNEKMKIYQVSKSLSYPVIVATGDQFFPYALRPPMYERIYAVMSYSRLVIDEVQAYDPVACAIVVKFMEDIVRLGGKFLLMTATLPAYVREEINRRVGKCAFKELNLYDKNKETYENLKKHRLKLRLIDNNKSEKNKPAFAIPDEYIDEIVQKAKEGKRVLVILNTVKQAEDVYKKIANIKEDNLILFHSRFTFNQKQEIKTKLEELLNNPKSDADKEGKILVATQVVEAALDIDADILYTEICPLDALVQRMGRVLRRYKDNYSHEGEDNVHVLVFKEGYESGNGRVYDRELIEKALILLARHDDFKAGWRENKKGEFVRELYEEYFQGKEEKKSKNKDKTGNIWKNLNVTANGILLSDYNKYQLLEEFYAGLNPSGKYLSDFYKTLAILDAGYMSDRRSDAQDIFRRIVNVSVVYGERKEKFKETLKSLVKGDSFSYTTFKDEILAEFVIQIPIYELKWRIPLAEWVREVEMEMAHAADETVKKRFLKLKEWCSGIYIADYDKGVF